MQKQNKQEQKLKIQAIIWSDNTNEEKERFITNLLSQSRQEAVEIVEKIEFKSRDEYTNEMIEDFRYEIIKSLSSKEQ